MSSNNDIRVLIVDDSALVREVLKKIIDSQSGMTVVGTACDPYDAREKIKKLAPDVLTLDIEMPRMDGLTFLRNLMRLRPMPVIMISTLTEASADVTLEALRIGAFDFVTKPKQQQREGLLEYEALIAEKITAAAGANVNRLEQCSIRSKKDTKPIAKPAKQYRPYEDALIAIGASTGGTEAIKEVLLTLPSNSPPTVIAQHIPAQFSASYAQRMDRLCQVTVHEAVDGQKLEPGNVYIAPGHAHLLIKRRAGGLYTQLSESERVNRHRPSVEVLFDSVTELKVKHTIGVLLTGMGNDGAQSMLRMKESGYVTIIQDERSSVVWGMPGAAFKLNAHAYVLALEAIGAKLISLTQRG